LRLSPHAVYADAGTAEGKALEDVGEMLVTSNPILHGFWFTQDRSILGDVPGAISGKLYLDRLADEAATMCGTLGL
jgi:hypothetical protein